MSLSGSPRPLLLDLCCGAGGAAKGYHDAGFDVIGVDLHPQPRYPYRFVQADALAFLQRLVDGGTWEWLGLGIFDAAHASFPCQRWSDLQRRTGRDYPDLVTAGREMLRATDLPYVIENVEGSPLHEPVVLCGTMFPELRVYRHRLFESNVSLSAPPHPRHAELTFTYDKRKGHYGRALDLETMRVQVTGGGNAPAWAKRQAMGIPWMVGRELNEAIPPAYTRHVGAQLLAALERVA